MTAVAAVALLAVNLRLVFGSSSAVATEIREAYRLGAVDAALLTTGPVVCLGLFGPLALRAARRRPTASVLTACLLVIAAGTAVRGIDSWPVLLGGTLLAGAWIAVANVLGPVFVREFFPDRIGMMTGLFTALVSASAGVASGATAPIAESVLPGWRATLAAWAAPTVLAVAVFANVTTRRRGAQRSSPERSPAGTGMLRSPTAWALTGFMGIQSLLAYSLIAWLPTLYRDRGLAAAEAGAVLTVLSVASIVTALTVPVIAARCSGQRLLAAAVVALSTVGLAGVLTAGPHTAAAWAVLLGLGQGGQLSLALTLVNLRAPTTDAAAGLSTMVQSIGYLVAATGPLLTGAVHAATGGWTAPVLVLLALMAPLTACGLIAGRAGTRPGDAEAAASSTVAAASAVGP
ncbi:MFS transporter [Tsukamurella sp. 1534]|uniref:MFS transporter n=1 Tax=Tsukamurella sp. 1534 TaxID=1151061 RepID=UPI0002EBDE51|nr:MFS transporter [Tsukamurella sp. 1534]